MKKSLSVIALLGAAGGFALREVQLAHSFDAAGLLRSGDPVSAALYALSALAVVAALLVCLRAPKCETPAIEERCSVLVPLCALALAISHLMTLEFDLLTGLALMTAALMLIELRPDWTKKLSVLGGCVLPLYLAVLLICGYRAWSRDPMVADFCYPLLFLIFAMLAAYHLAALRVGRGKRRLTAFYVAGSVCFALPAMAGAEFPAILRIAAVTLYLVADLWPYLNQPKS